MTTIDGFASARSMLAALREGQVSATKLLELHLQRIARYNPQLNAIVIPNEEQAWRCAAEADAAHARGESLGPLHGLPLTVKDLIAEGDKVVTRWTFRGTNTGDMVTPMHIPATGKQVTVTGITISRLAGGKFVEDWHQGDIMGFMQQLGVVPAPGQVS